VPPRGTPTIRFAVAFSTLLLPKSFFVPKKLGLYPKSNSAPTMPPPMAPALTPNVPRPLSMLLPNADPIHGLPTRPPAPASARARSRSLLSGREL